MDATSGDIGPTLAGRLRALIEEDIVAGRLPPGSELDERRLAECHGVSRTPVREVLRQLAAIGLVTLRPRQAAVVAAPDIRRLAQMFEALAGLDGLAAEFAARRMDDVALNGLSALHARIGAAVVAGDTEAFGRHNLDFHAAITAGGQNEYLAEQAAALRLRLEPYRAWFLRRMNRLAVSHREHGEILAALCEGRERDANDLMRRHVLDGDHFFDFVMLEGWQRRAEG